MKRMKQLIIIVVACSLSMTTMAQQSKVFIKGGLNLANISKNSDGEVDDANTLASFHVGLMADLPVGQFFAIQPGLLFTGKGSKIQNGSSSDNNYYKATTNPLYVELPVNAVFKIPLETNSQLFVGAGPYAALGVGGKRKIEGKLLGVEYSRKDNIEFSNDDPTTFNEEEGAGLGVMRRFDFGVNATAGLILNKFLVQVNYGLGLTKLQSGADNGEDNKNKHRVLSLSVGIGL
ncbi:porin family protein [Pseudoflavitalea rhizosphaerae]|uniref:porin family protein n=1 Tax=Pseudoflavitalea rhizosphaerae TaxID=1884793 RepID=UPI000F8DD182|nr:porin family protein [Pseudoflavitalea rhizosphaerae]